MDRSAWGQASEEQEDHRGGLPKRKSPALPNVEVGGEGLDCLPEKKKNPRNTLNLSHKEVVDQLK